MVFTFKWSTLKQTQYSILWMDQMSEYLVNGCSVLVFSLTQLVLLDLVSWVNYKPLTLLYKIDVTYQSSQYSWTNGVLTEERAGIRMLQVCRNRNTTIPDMSRHKVSLSFQCTVMIMLVVPTLLLVMWFQNTPQCWVCEYLWNHEDDWPGKKFCSIAKASKVTEDPNKLLETAASLMNYIRGHKRTCT